MYPQMTRCWMLYHGAAAAILFLAGSGCASGPDSRELNLAGQRALLEGRYAAARGLFLEAHELKPEDAPNLHDLGDCCLYFARRYFQEGNSAAALREVDHAIAYYDRAIKAHPGFEAALIGKNIALELKGQFDEALRVAQWAARFVGPSARQQIFLAREMEERGDLDAALLRFRQAVAIEPGSAGAHEALGRFQLRHGQREQAVANLTRAYQLEPTAARSALLADLGVPPTADATAGGNR